MSFDDFKRNLHESDAQESKDYDNPHFTDMLGSSLDTTNPKNLDRPKSSNAKSKIVAGISDGLSNRRYHNAQKRETRMEQDRGTLSEQDYHMKYANQGLAGKITIGIVLIIIVVSILMKILS